MSYILLLQLKPKGKGWKILLNKP